MSKIYVWVVLLNLSFTVCAAGGDKLQGAEAVNSGRYAEAYRLWLPLAEKGDREVQESLALLLSSNEDIGVKFSQLERNNLTLKWLMESAHNGQPSAMKWLADVFKNGWLGVPKDEVESVCWASAGSGISSPLNCKGLIRNHD